MCTCEADEIDALARQILQYLRMHSSAADTPQGIARWWLQRQRFEEAVERVQTALDQLVASAQVEARNTPTGAVLYTLRQSGAKQREVQS
jgi:hypothetical protein